MKALLKSAGTGDLTLRSGLTKVVIFLLLCLVSFDYSIDQPLDFVSTCCFLTRVLQ